MQSNLNVRKERGLSALEIFVVVAVIAVILLVAFQAVSKFSTDYSRSSSIAKFGSDPYKPGVLIVDKTVYEENKTAFDLAVTNLKLQDGTGIRTASGETVMVVEGTGSLAGKMLFFK